MMDKLHSKTYRFSNETIKELDFLAAYMARSRNSTLVRLIHAEYMKLRYNERRKKQA